MSGTSLDGIDGVLVDLPGGAGDVSALSILAHAHTPFDAGLRAELASLNVAGGADELHRAALAANALATLGAQVVASLLAKASLAADDIVAIGAHGQTVRHRPGVADGVGYTWQVHAPALLAERTGIDVVADFRSRDIAAGGQGAPLVPAFHRAVFGAGAGTATTVVLNLGGMSNVTILQADGRTSGFDCGPGNALLDAWSLRTTGRPYDGRGAIAASGRVDDRLLAALLDEPFFTAKPPKSTGRDLINDAWLDARLARSDAERRLAAADIQATLAELTARVVADAVRRHAAEADALVVCGGGAANDDLLARLARLLPGVAVTRSGDHGIEPNQVEAAAFAWLAAAFLERRPANVAEVTGAAGPRVLGALWPAR